MADITTLNQATATVAAFDYLRQGVDLAQQYYRDTGAMLAKAAVLAGKSVDPSIPSPIVQELTAMMQAVQTLYVDFATNHSAILNWTPGVDITVPVDIPNDPTSPST